MKIKVCGMRNPSNIEDLIKLKPDYIGFIFYPESKRFIGEKIPDEIHALIPVYIQKVGVFVDEPFNNLLEKYKSNSLDMIQLHGSELPGYCERLKKLEIPVIKVFSISTDFDFESVKPYEHYCDYYLFDTAGELPGGTGMKFGWEKLDQYSGDKPFFLSGGIKPADAGIVKNISHKKLYAVDINSGFEVEPGVKKYSGIEIIYKQNKAVMSYQSNDKGYYGTFGGAYIPEMMYENINHLQNCYLEIIESDEFRQEFRQLLQDYAGRPSPLYYSDRLSEHYHANIYLKREDLNHTGSHKINNTIGQILLAKRLGKTRIIAETGAGQHGVATATVCARAGLECIVYMGALDVARQSPNVEKMKMLGAEVRPVYSGNKTLKDATNEAIRDWINNPVDTHYIIGSVVGPHPYPDMVARFQSVISEEMRIQLREKTGKETPDYVIACVGGGSNAAGAFYHFLEEPDVKLIAVEAAGKGIETGESAATTQLGRPGILHGSRSLLMQTPDGQVIEPYSISAGLDYPGIGPLLANLFVTKRAQFLSATDEEALRAALYLTQKEGIIPALESAHALAALEMISFKPGDVVVVNISGRGDKDMEAYLNYYQSVKTGN